MSRERRAALAVLLKSYCPGRRYVGPAAAATFASKQTLPPCRPAAQYIPALLRLRQYRRPIDVRLPTSAVALLVFHLLALCCSCCHFYSSVYTLIAHTAAVVYTCYLTFRCSGCAAAVTPALPFASARSPPSCFPGYVSAVIPASH